MARLLNVTVPEEFTEELISKIKDRNGLLSLSLQKGSSIKPPGDILNLKVTNSTLHDFMLILEDFKLGQKGGVSLHTSEPDSVITNVPDHGIEKDGQEAIWEEMEMLISKDSNMSWNILIMMAMAGFISTVGLATSAIHVVIGGMLVAPGFMPIMRITLGLANENSYWYYGIIDTLKGYLFLMVGAVVATFILRWTGIDPLSPEQEYYRLFKTMVDYWTTVSPSSVIASIAAAIVGIYLVATKRTIFTSGVMIALALVPSASLIPITLISGEFELAGKAALRFIVDVGLILVLSYIIFFLKQKRLHKRTIKL